VSYSDQFVTNLVESFARLAINAASLAVLTLFQYINQPTDVVFATIEPAYNRVLAIALLVAGGVIAFALMERLLGGRRGAGAEVVVRTMAACSAAMLGLPLMRYAVEYADLLALVWNGEVLGGVGSVLSHPVPAYQVGAGQALGSTLGLLLVAALTLLLAVLVHVELVLRSALIVLTTTLLPLACVMAIWPRLGGTLTHMVGFLVALLLSKFVVATACYLGYTMVVRSYVSGGDSTAALSTGIATLAAAALAPVVLLQGVRFAEAGAAHASRGFSFGVGRGLGNIGSRLGRQLPNGGLGRLARSATSRVRAHAAQRRRAG
jgi:hypothetical protein